MYSCNSLPTFRDHLQGSRNSRRNYHYTLRNASEECRSHLLHGGSLGTAGVIAIFHRVMVQLQSGSRLQAGQCGVRIPAAARVISLLQNVRTDSRAHQTSYSIIIGVIFPLEVKRPERDVNHSPPSSAEVRNECR